MPKGELSLENRTKVLREKLMCGFDPEALDPAIVANIELVAKLMSIAMGKTPDQLKGMSMTDLSKAIINLQKSLDGMARLRSFSAGGPDSKVEGPEFVLKVVKPEEEESA